MINPDNVNFPAVKARFGSMKIVQHWISLIATFTAVFSGLYLLLDYTLGLIPGFRNWMLGPVTGRSVVFSTAILVFIIRYVKIRSPYSR